MSNDAFLETVNWRGKESMHLASRKRRIIVVDELLFMLLWSSGYIGFKIGLSLSGAIFAIFFTASYNADRMASLWQGA